MVDLIPNAVLQVEFTLARYAFIVFGTALSVVAATGAMSHVLSAHHLRPPLGLPVEPAIRVI